MARSIRMPGPSSHEFEGEGRYGYPVDRDGRSLSAFHGQIHNSCRVGVQDPQAAVAAGRQTEHGIGRSICAPDAAEGSGAMGAAPGREGLEDAR